MLRLQGIGLTLPSGEELIRDISLEIPAGKLTVITGPNGGGKTTLAKIIAGLTVPTRGSLFLDDQDITEWSITKRAQHGIGYAFQQPVRLKGINVRDLLELAAGEALQNCEACALLSEVGLCAPEYLDRDVDASLSGGESKRIEIATVLARRNMKMLIFDEPEAGIDLWSFTSLITAFQRLKEVHGEALLVISHQERILEIADQIVVISGGEVRLSGSRETVLPSLLAEEKANHCPLAGVGQGEVQSHE